MPVLLDDFIKNHLESCYCEMAKDYRPEKCDCGQREAAAELAALRAELAALKEATWIPAVGKHLPGKSGDYNVLLWNGKERVATFNIKSGWGDGEYLPYQVIAWKPWRQK